jgi:membrane associated rhomboid family serine protease
MAYRDSFSGPFGMMLTLWVRRLLIANGAIFVVLLLLRQFGLDLQLALSFRPVDALARPWGIVTYMFVHASFFHVLFNMLALFFFGPVLEDRWGSRQFIKFYLLCGLAGAAFSLVFPYQAIVGASAAVYGIMVAFAMYWPDNPIYIWGIFPVRAKYLVGFLVGISVFLAISGDRSGTAHLAHLGGAFAAFAYIKSPWAPSEFGETYGSPRKSRRAWREYLPGRRRKPQPVRPVVPQRPRAAPTKPARLDDDVDRILDKISAGGIGSLTAEERQRLEDASRQRGTN